MKLKDRLWLWGHGRQIENIAGKPLNLHGRPGIGKLSCAEAAREMGIPNLCRIVLEPAEKPPYDRELEEAGDMGQIVWSGLGCGMMEARNDFDEVIACAKKFPNITGAIMDDFFPNTNDLKAFTYTPQVLKGIREKLHNNAGRKLDLWVVVYSWDFNYDTIRIEDYLEQCDVASIWTYNADELPKLEQTIAKMREKWGYDKPLFAGCYMWDFPNKRPIPPEMMTYQLDTLYRYLKEGKLDGIIFCHNYVVDIGLDAVEQVKNWIALHGEEDF